MTSKKTEKIGVHTETCKDCGLDLSVTTRDGQEVINVRHIIWWPDHKNDMKKALACESHETVVGKGKNND